MNPVISIDVSPSPPWGGVRGGGLQMPLDIPSSSSGLTRGSTLTNAGFFIVDSRVKPDYDELGAKKIEFQNKKAAFLELTHV